MLYELPVEPAQGVVPGCVMVPGAAGTEDANIILLPLSLLTTGVASVLTTRNLYVPAAVAEGIVPDIVNGPLPVTVVPILDVPEAKLPFKFNN